MTERYVVAVKGISALTEMRELPQQVVTAARRAVNRTVDRTRTRSARAIRAEVNLPASYLSGKNGRLRVKQYAQGDNLTGVIEGRQRPTSLATFVTSASKKNVSVQVSPGRTRQIPRAFLIKLRAGTADIDTRFNQGLALRLRPGEKINNKTKMVKLSGNLYLLYGPSVDQVFSHVAEDEAPEAARFMEDEFLRLMEL